MIIRFSNETDLLRALDLCEHLGYRWRAGQKPTEYVADVVRYFMEYSYVYIQIKDAIITYTYGDGDAWDDEYEKSITVDEFFNTFKQQNGVYILN